METDSATGAGTVTRGGGAVTTGGGAVTTGGEARATGAIAGSGETEAAETAAQGIPGVPAKR